MGDTQEDLVPTKRVLPHHSDSDFNPAEYHHSIDHDTPWRPTTSADGNDRGLTEQAKGNSGGVQVEQRWMEGSVNSGSGIQDLAVCGRLEKLNARSDKKDVFRDPFWPRKRLFVDRDT